MKKKQFKLLFLVFLICFINSTKIYSQTISSAFVSSPILCYGGFASDSMKVIINQTPIPSQYKCLIGYFINNSVTPNPGDFFLSYVSTQNTTANQLNLNGFLPTFQSGPNSGQTINYFVRIVDSTVYYPAHTNGNGSGMVGVIDQFGPVNFFEPPQLNITLSSTNIANCIGLNDGTAIANVSGGTPFSPGTSYHFLWMPIGQTTQSISGLSPGVYTSTVSDLNGCTTSASTTVSTPLYGCTDSLAYNYDSLSTCDDASCIPYIYGCTDPLAFNYDPNVNTDDGSCIPFIYGCIDTTACNYDILANSNNGSCLTDYGCTDILAFNYDPIATCDDGSCIPFISGCIDSTATNYDPFANTDDGSCNYCEVSIIQNDTSICLGDNITLGIINDTICNASPVSGGYYIGSFANSCYFQLDTAVSWTLANLLANSNAVDLLAINSQQEADYINSITGNINIPPFGANAFWLGLIDGNSNWTNSEPLLFTNYDATYIPNSGEYMFLQTNGYWDNSDNIGSGSNDGMFIIFEVPINSNNTVTTLWSTGDTTTNITVNPSQTTTYYVTKTQNGISCIDSVIVNVNQPTYSTTTITQCDSYTWPVDGNIYSTSGIYTNISTNSVGCIHTETLVLTIITSISGSTTITACDSYTWEGQSTTVSNTLSYTYVGGSNTGCDSTHNLNVLINNSTSLVVFDTACGDYLFGANLLDSSGTYIDTFLTSYNCDSIVTLELTIYGDSSVTYITSCDSAEFNGVWYYNDTIVTDSGFFTNNTFGGINVDNTGKEGNIWYFGENAGLDFNTGTPIPLIDGQINTLEGCASISDYNGDLLFYTDGMSVYTKNHTLMINGSGLLGNSSSTQSAVIVQKPGSVSNYYIFTVDSDWSGNYYGTRFSEVDITLNGGLGEVISSTKNTLIVSPSAEKICAVRHFNENDIWIITHPSGSSDYYAYLLTDLGLDMTPVISSVGSYIVSSDSGNQMGYLKSSPNGELIANGSFNSNLVQVFDFDNNTGLLSNPIDLNGFNPDSYGVEFSSNSQILYVSDFSNGSIYQFNLLAGTGADINNSKIHLGYCPNPGALQLGPDEKIYIAEWQSSYIGVIDFPNTIGSGCSYNSSSLYLNGKLSKAGLPTFYNSIFMSPPTGCDSVATAIIDIKNSSSNYIQVAQCDSFTWALNGQTYYASQIDTIQSTNIDGCQHIDSLDLLIYPEVNVSAIITDELCVNYSDGSIVLSVTGGLGTFLYNWSGPNAFYDTNQDIFNLAPGTYNLIITDLLSSCTKDTSFVINPGFDMQVIMSQSNISCYDSNDGSINITPINLMNPVYSWSDISSSLEDRTNMSPGLYYLQIDDNNCFIKDTFVFNQPDSIFIIAQQTLSVCLSGNSGEISVQAFGGTPAFSYFWSNWAGNSPVNSNLSPGFYELDIYDNNGCLFEESFTINSYQINVSSNVDHIDCFGDSTGSIDVTVSGGFSPYVYLWSDGTNSEDIYNLPEGIVSCSIIDYLGCTISESFVITEENPIETTVSINSVSCYGGNDGSAILSISGGVGPYSIDWYNIDENNLYEGTYFYEVTDDNGCILQDVIYVSQQDSLEVTVDVTDLNCSSDPEGEISISIDSGGLAPFAFSWTGPNSFTSSQEDIDNLYAGLYILTIEDANGCFSEYQITVGEPTAVSHYINIEQSNYSSYNISCHNGNDGWITINPSGGYLPYTYLWSSGSNSNTIDNLIAGTYSLTITNGIGCQESFVLNLNEPSESVSAIPSSLNDYNGFDISCFDGSDGAIIVETSGGVSPYSYFWNNEIGFNPHILLSSGIYNLEVVDNNNCSYFESIILQEPEILNWIIDIFSDTCEKKVGKVDVDLSGGVPPYNYSWNYYENLPIAIQVVEGDYFIEFTDANSCKAYDTIFVDNLIGPDIDFVIYPDYKKLYEQLDDPIVYIDKTELVWQNVISWFWDFGDNSYGYDSIAYHSYQDTGTYFVTLSIETDYGCIDTLTKRVVIAEYDLFIPNAFTPNPEDNINQGFRPYGIGIDEFLMNIYTRWGEKVFTTNDIQEFWNGRYNNNEKECQIGLYLYYIEVKDVFGALHKYEGQVNLIR